ncbi:hypothetical protein SAMN02745216_01094 [Desulfatibacillum alkenivorans DSM 16219]|jgi:tetratricopeptide (TPR) repeat protein|uniref:Uncharacterized protein n=1 Tax=Desulfatibacillum alkenivorans DSM 16219 TaxID=1121393 RepID=A0A1M6GSI8_9BACT|nr:hypothetical protein [Desulfatibacillum alkenivorans]SHJ12894.1 hypothetical protein SAMN02745216_01094 [Desulfatibacillum alkenivorans DSM 16219]
MMVNNEINDAAAPQPQEAERTLPGPWPWYVILLLGFGLGGFFVWLMVCWALWARNEKKRSLIALAANLLVFAGVRYASLNLLCSWWVISLGAVFLDLAWTVAAWRYQYVFIGPAPPRYKNLPPVKWLAPVLIGGLLGFCIAALISIPQAIENRIAMLSLWDSLNREIVLWDFFKGAFAGIAGGVFVGAWWAGNPKGFKVRDIVCYLGGTLIAWIGLLLLFKLQGYYLTGGGEALDMDSVYNSVIPPWGGKDKQFVLTMGSYIEFMGFILIPLLFGAPGRIRDFGLRALVVPLVFICSFPYWMTSNSQWMDYQGRIMYLAASPDQAERDYAFDKLKTLLARYPDHARWPYLAEKYVAYLYHQGEFEKAEEYNRRIAENFEGQNRWYWIVSQAKSVQENYDPSKRNPGEWLNIPVVDDANYLTANWMSLLAAIRYWEGEDVPESQIKTRLRAMSETEDLINLRPLLSFVHLDDAAANLGYKTLVLPSDLPTAQRLLDKGIPVFMEGYQLFYLMYGFDKGRNLALTYNFSSISNRQMKNNRDEAGEVLGLEDEGRGKSRMRRERIRREAYWEMAPEVWEAPVNQIISPFMAVVIPEQYLSIAAEAAGLPKAELIAQSKARIAALISLQFTKAGDPVNAIEWAMASAEKWDSPIPFYMAYLAASLWADRSENLKSRIRLEKGFDELKTYMAYFDKPEIKAFLDKSAAQFEADLKDPGLPRMVGMAYLSFLHKSDPRQRRIIADLYKQWTQTDPSRYRTWAKLADLYEFANDIPNMVAALEGMIKAGPAAHSGRLKAAYGYILLGQPEKAKETLEHVEAGGLRHDADYQFVLGAIAEWEEKPEKALTHYAAAVDMRRHIPVYHLYYGRALLAEGQDEDAKKALEWACRIDPDTEVTEQARKMLENMD